MAITDFSPDAIEENKLQRQQQMADMLRQQGMTQDQGRMVGNYYVAPSWTQNLNKVAQTLVGNQMQEGVYTKQKALADAIRQRNISETNAISDAMHGTEAQFTLPEGQQGPQIQAQAPNMKMAAALAMNSQNPTWQQWGMTQMMPKLPKWEKFDKPDGQGGHVSGFIDTNSQNPIATFQAGGSQPAKLEGVNTGGNTTFVNPYAPKMEGAPVIAATANPFKDEVVGDGQGGVVPNAPLVAVKKDIRAAGKTTVNNNVSVAAPENKYNADIGTGLAKDSLDLVNAGKAAPEVVNNARMIKSALDNGAITGSAADTRLAVQKAAETLGIVKPGTAATTQALMAGLGKLTLSGIKTSGLGGGNGFTDKDREFLNAAISGQITDTPENLRRVADLSERVAIATHAKASQVIERWRNDPALRNVVQDTVLDPIAQPSSQSSPGGNVIQYDAQGNRVK